MLSLYRVYCIHRGISRSNLNLASSPGLKNRTKVIVGGEDLFVFRVILIEKNRSVLHDVLTGVCNLPRAGFIRHSTFSLKFSFVIRLLVITIEKKH